jgi:hypothetical protein
VEIKKKIMERQQEILCALIEYEESIAILYHAYAEAFQEEFQFWESLSNEEKVHASLLRVFLNQVTSGSIFRNLGRFKVDEVRKMIQQNRVRTADAQKQSISLFDALGVALEIEHSIVEAHFYDIVDSDIVGYRKIAKKLLIETIHHRKMIEQKITELNSLSKADGSFSRPDPRP